MKNQQTKPEWPRWERGASAGGGTGGPPRKRRVFMWIFLAIQAFFLILLLLIAGEAQGTPEGGDTVMNAVLVMVPLWVVVDFILGVSYAIYRMSNRR